MSQSLDTQTTLLIVASAFSLPEFSLPNRNKSKGKKAKTVFKGSEGVDCMVEFFHINRSAALIIGQRLLSTDYIRSSSTSFRDDATLYTHYAPETELDINFLRDNLNNAVTNILEKKMEHSINVANEIAARRKLNGSDQSPTSPPSYGSNTSSSVPHPSFHPNLGLSSLASSSGSGAIERRRAPDKKPGTYEDSSMGYSGNSSSSSSSSSHDANGNFIEEEDSDDIKFNYSDASYQFPKIKAATIDKLVERLTHETYPDLKFRDAFLLTYRSFVTPRQLIQKLAQRFCDPSSPKEAKKSIQLRVIGVIKSWVDSHIFDFCDDQSIKTALIELIDGPINKDMAGPAQNLKKSVLKKFEQSNIISSELGVPPVPPRSFTLPSFEEMNEMDLANQLTLVEFSIYRAIAPKECLNLAWSKRKDEAPHILSLIDQFNRTSRWVQYEIVKQVQLKGRTAIIEKFIELAMKLYELNNFNGVMEIISGLNSSPIRRLKKAWEELSDRSKAKLKALETVMSHEGSFKEYRNCLHNTQPPSIPYLGVYLTDLTFIEEGNTDTTDGLINFDKRYKIAAVIQEIQQYQDVGYDGRLSVVGPLQIAIRNWDGVGEEETYSLSMKIEPRNPNEAIENLLMEEERLRNDMRQLQIRNAELENSNKALHQTIAMLTNELKKYKRTTMMMANQPFSTVSGPSSSSSPASSGTIPGSTLFSSPSSPPSPSLSRSSSLSSVRSAGDLPFVPTTPAPAPPLVTSRSPSPLQSSILPPPPTSSPPPTPSPPIPSPPPPLLGSEEDPSQDGNGMAEGPPVPVARPMGVARQQGGQVPSSPDPFAPITNKPTLPRSLTAEDMARQPPPSRAKAPAVKNSSGGVANGSSGGGGGSGRRGGGAGGNSSPGGAGRGRGSGGGGGGRAVPPLQRTVSVGVNLVGSSSPLFPMSPVATSPRLMGTLPTPTAPQQATTSLTTLPGGMVAISPSVGRFGVPAETPDRPVKAKRLSDESRPSGPRVIQRDLGGPRNRHSRVICEDEMQESIPLPLPSSSSSSGLHNADDALVRARGESSPVKITRNRSLPSEQI